MRTVFSTTKISVLNENHSFPRKFPASETPQKYRNCGTNSAVVRSCRPLHQQIPADI